MASRLLRVYTRNLTGDYTWHADKRVAKNLEGVVQDALTLGCRGEKFFSENNLRPNNLIEIGNSDAIKQAVAANMGISLLSIHTLKLELQV